MASLSKHRKVVMTALLVLVLIGSCFEMPRSYLFENRAFTTVDSVATDYVDQALLRAAASFAMARTFNGVISVFQESTLQLEPGGVGVSLALGAALDPINDLIERFSWVMLVSLTSLGSQKFLIEITPFVSVQIILALALIVLLLGLWLPLKYRPQLTRSGVVLVVTAVVLRFAVPAMAYINEQVYVTFLQEKHDLSVEVLGRTVADLESQQLDNLLGPTEGGQQEETEGESPQDEKGIWSKTKELVNQTMSQGQRMLEAKNKIELLKKMSLELIDQIVDLIVVFVLNTILLPLIFLWAIMRFGTLLLRLLPLQYEKQI
ncbi:hypothetical protein [Desulfosediminicola ganghwensis]|uniref:hypothetical protein n=1 Tax=Desulfosediminicola ganghwensis TaxID=2569540 RepID=UPI0010AD6E3A|nr:hypothetical protein [Desulfosediminicola ganghwensis]